MKITNKNKLPQALVTAVANDSYSKGEADRSVTGLLSPPRQSALFDLHEAEITEDVSDRIWSLYGQIAHGILERAGEKSLSEITEERLFTEVGGWIISGQTDSLTVTDDQESWIISDYKFVTSYRFQRDSNGNVKVQDQYEEQLNLYAYLLESNGFPVAGLKIVALYRDWSKLEAKRNSNYPPEAAETHSVPLWSQDKAKAFIEERVRLHQEAEDNLPECSEDDRWSRPTKYALMNSKTSKRARKLFFGYAAAVEWASDDKNKMKAGWVIERRLGEDIRCENYCPVSEYCQQFEESSKRAKNWVMSEWLTEMDETG